jgi:hypothetical protein
MNLRLLEVMQKKLTVTLTKFFYSKYIKINRMIYNNLFWLQFVWCKSMVHQEYLKAIPRLVFKTDALKSQLRTVL